MADFPLRTLQDLATTERTTALMAAVSDDTATGEGRKFTIAELAQALQAVNALTVTTERVMLFDGNPANGNNNLDIRTGSTRHSFDDGYFAIEFYVGNSSWADDSHADKYIPIQTWVATTTSNRIQMIYFLASAAFGRSLYFVSNTSFNTNGTFDDMQVYGHRFTLALTTP